METQLPVTPETKIKIAIANNEVPDDRFYHFHEDFQGMAAGWRKFTYWFGCGLLGLGISVVMTAIFSRRNNPPWKHDESHEVLEFFLFWSQLFWIAMLEGCQISVVGLQGTDPETFKESHPRAYKCCTYVHRGANVERFLVGRQFLLLFNGFLVSRTGGGAGHVIEFTMGDWNWGPDFTGFFFSNGVLLMIVIVALGQLPTQLVAADKMLGFFDLPLGHYYLVLIPCMAVESLGFTHSSYILKDFLVWISGIDPNDADPAKAMKKDWEYYIKCAFSVCCVIFSGIFITKGLILSQTNATEGPGWDQLPGGAAVVVSFFFVFMLACAEGLQVSIIALATVPASEFRHKAPLAYRTAKLGLAGRNLSAFLVGRQFLTAMNMVLLARVTSYAGGDGDLNEGGDWGMGKFFNYALLQTGFLGAIFVVNVSQLASQVTASIFPISVINNYFMYWMLQLMLFIERIGIVNACWPLAYLLDRAFGMKPDPPATVIKPRSTATNLQGMPTSGTLRTIDEFHYHQDFIGMDRTWRRVTYWLGSGLLAFAVTVVTWSIFTRANNPPWDKENSHPWLEFFLFLSQLFWIAMLEGCQISVVGLQGHDPEKFKHSHPRAYKCCKLVHSGANVERFLVGRQFLLLFNGFLCSRTGGGAGDVVQFVMGDWIWGRDVTGFFFSNGVLLMIVIVALAQLPTQLSAADKMFGFFDLPFAHYYLTIMPCMIVESIGLTHSSYILKDFLVWISGINPNDADPEKEMKRDWLYYAKCALSVSAVIFSGIFIIKGLALSQTNATEGAGWNKLPGGVAVVVSLFFVFMLACAEGLQVSVIALATVPASEYKDKSPLAYRTAKLALSGRNMSAFLVGRQFLTAMNMVLLARVTSYAGPSAGVLLDGGDWGMGKGFNYLLQTGFIGAIFVVNVAQLASQVTASIFPISVINNYFMYWMLKLMLFIEMIGIVNACWPLAYLLDRAFDMQPDPTDTFKEKRNERGTSFTPEPQKGFKQEFESTSVTINDDNDEAGKNPVRPMGVYDGINENTNRADL